MTISTNTAYKYLSFLENEIKHCAQTYRDFSYKMNQQIAYNNGDRFAEKSYWSIEEYTDYLKSIKIRQYETYIILCDFIESARIQNTVLCHSNLKSELININPLFMVTVYDTVESELKLLTA